MSQTADLSSYPLPEALTRRMLTYLNVFRLFISLALTIAYFIDPLTRNLFLESGTIVATILVDYIVLAVYLAFEAR